MRDLTYLAFPLILLHLPRQAMGTYSIAATDKSTRQIGGIGTSCVPSDLYPVLYGGAPGYGVIHAQALTEGNDTPRDLAVELLKNGTHPEEIVDIITTDEVDPECCFLDVSDFKYNLLRQYGVVDLDMRSAGYTGEQIDPLYTILGLTGTVQEDVQGTIDNFTYAVQGNVVTPNVVSNAETGFVTGGGCDLADRLMLALETGAANGEGDYRCTSEHNITASSSFLHVDNPDGTVVVHLTHVGDADIDAVDAVENLREQYDLWRASNPCAIEAVPAEENRQDAVGQESVGSSPSSNGIAETVLDSSEASYGTIHPIMFLTVAACISML